MTDAAIVSPNSLVPGRGGPDMARGLDNIVKHATPLSALGVTWKY